ncbi:hypothetical protein AB0B30_37425 [Streptomyces narbonensis]|uniref:Uncharacterized protein n=1 Tax=Streptomyces narbonensis TaxID=67333 RepID=A0ABV3CLY9_9ACTN
MHVRPEHRLQVLPRQYPGAVYSLVADLSRTARMLPQALDQAQRLIADLDESGNLRSDKDQLEQDVRETLLGWRRRALRRSSCTQA